MAAADIENVTTSADKLKLALAVVLVLAGLGGFYTLGAQGVWVQWAVLLVGLIAGGVTFLVSLQGRQLIGFGRESWRELHKVVWPTRKESMQMTAYVFAFVVIMALFLWLTDKSLEWLLYDLILGWKK
jgi:preprotein translocase subunit SecE